MSPKLAASALLNHARYMAHAQRWAGWDQPDHAPIAGRWPCPIAGRHAPFVLAMAILHQARREGSGLTSTSLPRTWPPPRADGQHNAMWLGPTR